MTRNEQLTVGVLAAAALILLAAGAKKSPGGSVKTPARVTEDWAPWHPEPDRPVVGPAQFLNGYVYTPHRYPPACGADLTVLIHRGLSTLSLPSESDMLWLSGPPSEGVL